MSLQGRLAHFGAPGARRGVRGARFARPPRLVCGTSTSMGGFPCKGCGLGFSNRYHLDYSLAVFVCLGAGVKFSCFVPVSWCRFWVLSRPDFVRIPSAGGGRKGGGCSWEVCGGPGHAGGSFGARQSSPPGRAAEVGQRTTAFKPKARRRARLNC